MENGTAVIKVLKATEFEHGTEIGWSSSYGDGLATFYSTLFFYNDYYILDGKVRGADWQIGYGFKIKLIQLMLR